MPFTTAEEYIDAQAPEVQLRLRELQAIVREVRGLPHGSSKWHTARVVARQRQTEEAQEGFRAFSEKRPPAWTPDKD